MVIVKSWMKLGPGLIASTLITALGLTACGSDPDKAAEFTKSFQAALQSDQDTKYSAAEAQCVAKPLVLALTVKQLEAKKITPKQVTAAKDLDDLNLGASASQATAIADEIVRCVDPSRNLLEAAKESNPDLKADAKAQKCLRDNLRKKSVYRDNLRDSIEKGSKYEPDNEMLARFALQTMGECDLALYPRSAYVEAGVSSFNSNTKDSPLTESNAECFMGGLVDVITPEKLGREGIDPPAFEDEDGPNVSDVVNRDDVEKLAKKFEECVDLVALIRKVVDRLRVFDAFPQAFVDCYVGRLQNDPQITRAFRDAYIAGFLGDNEAAANIDFTALGRELGGACAEGL